MAREAENSGGRGGMPWRMIGWGTAALLLLLPLVTNAPWTAFDFAFAGVLIGGVGLGVELVARGSNNLAYRLGGALAIVTGALVVMANGAVGMIGSEGDPFNLLFAGVLLIALGGAMMARFQPAGVARAMVAAALAQVAIASMGLSTDVRGALLSMAMAALWVLAAALFRKAAREQVTRHAGA